MTAEGPRRRGSGSGRRSAAERAIASRVLRGGYCRIGGKEWRKWKQGFCEDFGRGCQGGKCWSLCSARGTATA
ncbi:hypothetical protein Zm00014a_034289 [Zea mays]|uniref:Uncharacterized protein n=1 Tax=Zea mays TaxID=4577 RepID=A0A3L6ETR4_MAIZE|nr:hypothetical protein Zm00014a_034289 [Zea mays]